jgi:hypothetical protein
MHQESRKMKQFKEKPTKEHRSTHTIAQFSRDTAKALEQIFKSLLRSECQYTGHCFQSLLISRRGLEFNLHRHILFGIQFTLKKKS